MALEIMLMIYSGGKKDVSTVATKANSEYLVRGITDWIFRWEQNGFLATTGLAVTNADHFKQSQSLV